MQGNLPMARVKFVGPTITTQTTAVRSSVLAVLCCRAALDRPPGVVWLTCVQRQEVAARPIFSHPTQNFGVVQFDPSLVSGSFTAAVLSSRETEHEDQDQDSEECSDVEGGDDVESDDNCAAAEDYGKNCVGGNADRGDAAANVGKNENESGSGVGGNGCDGGKVTADKTAADGDSKGKEEHEAPTAGATATPTPTPQLDNSNSSSSCCKQNSTTTTTTTTTATVAGSGSDAADSPPPLRPGDTAEFYGLTAANAPVRQRAAVVKLERLSLASSAHPQFTAHTVEVTFFWGRRLVWGFVFCCCVCVFLLWFHVVVAVPLLLLWPKFGSLSTSLKMKYRLMGNEGNRRPVAENPHAYSSQRGRIFLCVVPSGLFWAVVCTHLRCYTNVWRTSRASRRRNALPSFFETINTIAAPCSSSPNNSNPSAARRCCRECRSLCFLIFCRTISHHFPPRFCSSTRSPAALAASSSPSPAPTRHRRRHREREGTPRTHHRVKENPSPLCRRSGTRSPSPPPTAGSRPCAACPPPWCGGR